MLWVDKHKPADLSEFVDQRRALRAFVAWMNMWRPGTGALLLYGPPGTGKTCLVETYAKVCGLDLIQMAASDYRTAAQVRQVLGGAATQQSLTARGKVLLIDEIEGLIGAADRGGVGEIVRLIKRSVYPVILTARDPWEARFKKLRAHCQLVEFVPIPATDIERRLRQICQTERVKPRGDTLKLIAERSGGDLRAAINDLEVIARGRSEICQADLAALGWRERETDIHEMLRVMFRGGDLTATRRAIRRVDVPPEDVLWWIEENVWREYTTPEEIAAAFDLLSRADMCRARWALRQMVDLMATITLAKRRSPTRAVRYRYPAKMALLARTRAQRRRETERLAELAQQLHCSVRKVRHEFLPWLKLIEKVN
jgi:replication factor C large subunit